MVPVVLIAAVNKKRAIGKDNNLMYNIPEDMMYFKEATTNNVVIMGRNTYESIGIPLPDRTCIVVTSDPESLSSVPGFGTSFLAFTDLRRAIDIGRAIAAMRNMSTVFIAGGEQIYKESMVIADGLLLTEIDDDADGDRYFPPYAPTVWFESSRSELFKSEVNPEAPSFQFVSYTR